MRIGPVRAWRVFRTTLIALNGGLACGKVDGGKDRERGLLLPCPGGCGKCGTCCYHHERERWEVHGASGGLAERQGALSHAMAVGLK